jgi:hypothetical protein
VPNSIENVPFSRSFSRSQSRRPSLLVPPAAVPFYGRQPAPEDVPKIKTPLLVHYLNSFARDEKTAAKAKEEEKERKR